MKGVMKRGEKGFPVQAAELLPGVNEIWFEGNRNLLQSRMIAVVGSRRCTQYGKTVAGTIGQAAAEAGVTVISGLARGIDTEAHRSTMEAGGRTIAVVGGGTGYYYPAENKKLQQEIGNEGLLLSLHPEDYRPHPYDFPVRNRLISALAESVAVVEAGRDSGALITAECAGAFGKNVYAVPGNITSHYSFGTNQLIRDGVTPLIFIGDLFIDLGISLSCSSRRIGELSRTEQAVYRIIKESGQITAEEIYHKTDMKLSEIHGMITVLEIKGFVYSSCGCIFDAGV